MLFNIELETIRNFSELKMGDLFTCGFYAPGEPKNLLIRKDIYNNTTGELIGNCMEVGSGKPYNLFTKQDVDVLYQAEKNYNFF